MTLIPQRQPKSRRFTLISGIDFLSMFAPVCMSAVFIASWGAAFILMIGLGVAGLLEISKGIFVILLPSSSHLHTTDETNLAATALGSVLEGFEYLLLAPIPLAVIVVIARYLSAFLAYEPLTGRGEKGGGEGAAKHKAALHQYHLVKQLILSLMISVVATDLIKRFLNNQLQAQEASFRGILFGGVLFVLLIVYLLIRSKLDQQE